MQIALVDMQRRVQGRVPCRWIQVDPEWMRAQQAAGRPLVRFRDIPLEWSDFRLTLRQTADILLRFDALERADYDKILALGRDGTRSNRWWRLVRGDRGRRAGQRPATARPSDAPASLDQVLVLALRPFLARCAESLTPQVDLASWNHGHCPICGWEPDFAVITADGRSAPVLRTLRRAVELCAADLSLLRQRGPRADHVVRDARRPLSRLRV